MAVDMFKEETADIKTEAWLRPLAIYLQVAISSIIIVFVFKMFLAFIDNDEESALSNYQRSE